MSGYRQHSFDPDAYEQPGRPSRPFNWVQWSGVAMASAGVALQAVYFAGRFGLIDPLPGGSPATIWLLLLGVILINSRRQPAHDPAPELAAERKRLLFITVAICAVIFGAAAIIEFLGAN